MKKNKIFLLPYAGGSSLVYYNWIKLLSDSFEVINIELAGRGKRLDEPFYGSINEAVEDIAEIINSYDLNYQYSIFGHSMGALLAFEVYYKLKEKKINLPRHIFLSGRGAPHIKHKRLNIQELNEEMFLELVALYDGLSEDFYDDEVKKVFLPVLRADFTLVDEYVYSEKNDKLNCNISVLYSDNDFCVNAETAEEWKNHSNGKVDIICFPGKHFYINEHYRNICDLIKNKLLKQEKKYDK